MNKNRDTKPNREDAAECLQCGRAGSLARGLCKTCHSRFYRAKKRLPINRWPAFESRLIAMGKLKPSDQGRRTDLPDSASVYDVIADEMLAAEAQSEYDSAKKRQTK
jgi:hypothetical protein